jgi:curved DNA-binding protein CbpA
MDPFDTLGLAPTFSVSAGEISRAYLQRAALVHPDLDISPEPGADADEPAEGSTDAAEVLNRARAVLLNPELRAGALLARLGGPGPEDRSLPPGFLVQMMERREEVEASIASEGVPARARWRAWAAQERSTHMARVTDLFERVHAGDGDQPRLLREIRIELNAWRYIERLIEQLDEQERPDRPGTGRTGP